MTKLYCLHEIELRPGVSPAEFEKVAAEAKESANYEGWTAHLLKGERGERNGKYLVLYEIESIAARDRYAPTADGPYSAETEEISRRNAELWERWRKMATMPGEDTVYTDYEVMM